MTGIRISDRLQVQVKRGRRDVIGLLSFSSPPGSQQAFQIGEAAGVAALLDVMKQMPSAAGSILPALGKEGFEIPW